MLVTEILDGVYHFFFEHPYEIFQNIIGLVQDQLTGNHETEDPLDYPKYLAADWEVRIGNSENPYENPVCGERESRIDYQDVYSDSPNVLRMVPSYGF